MNVLFTIHFWITPIIIILTDFSLISIRSRTTRESRNFQWLYAYFYEGKWIKKKEKLTDLNENFGEKYINFFRQTGDGKRRILIIEKFPSHSVQICI